MSSNRKPVLDAALVRVINNNCTIMEVLRSFTYGDHVANSLMVLAYHAEVGIEGFGAWDERADQKKRIEVIKKAIDSDSQW